MKVKTPYFEIQIESLFIIVSVILLLCKRLHTFFKSFYICYLFIVFHELSHIFIASIFGKSIEKLKFSLSGVNVSFVREKYNIKKSEINHKEIIKNTLIYIAGPISNFLFAIIFNKIKMVYEINIFLGVLNLIPIYPLDGYNILRNIILFIFFDNNICQKKMTVINKIMIFIFIIFSILFAVIQKNISSIIFLLYLYLLNKTKANNIAFNS